MPAWSSSRGDRMALAPVSSRRLGERSTRSSLSSSRCCSVPDAPLTPLSPGTGPTFERERALPGGWADRLRPPSLVGAAGAGPHLDRGLLLVRGAVDVHALAVDAQCPAGLDGAYRRGTAQRRHPGTACGERGDCEELCLQLLEERSPRPGPGGHLRLAQRTSRAPDNWTIDPMRD